MSFHKSFPDAVGGDTYTPAMMEFDGSTGYYNKTYTSSGNKITGIFRFNRASFTGDKAEYLLQSRGPTGDARLGIYCISNDYTAHADWQDIVGFFVQNSSSTVVCRLFSPASYLDGQNHTGFVSFDGDTGVASFFIDGSNADDTGNSLRVAPTTATLDAGASSIFYSGTRHGPADYFSGQSGFLGVRDTYLTNWSDFMDANGNPKALDESGWTEWGAQPLFWNEHGEMTNNLGSAGDMTENGTIIVGKGGN